MRKIALLVAIFLLVGITMAFGKTLVLFCEVNGRLVDTQGSPAAGLQVSRSWRADGPGIEGSDNTVTAQDGTFHFAEVTSRSFLAGIIPQSATVVQEITATGSDGRVNLIYALDKSNYERDGELLRSPYTGPGLNMVCRIDAEPNDEGWFWGTCQPTN